MRAIYKKFKIILIVLSIIIFGFFWSYQLQFRNPDFSELTKHEKRKYIYNQTILHHKLKICDSDYQNIKKDINIKLSFHFPIFYFNGVFIVKDDYIDSTGIAFDRHLFFSKKIEKNIKIKNVCFSPKDNFQHRMSFNFIEKSGECYTWFYEYNPFDFRDTVQLDLLLTFHENSSLNHVKANCKKRK